MRRLLPLFLLTFTSCATLFNEPTTSVHIRISEPAKILYKGDTVYSQVRDKTNIAVLKGIERNKKDNMTVDVIGDNARKKVILFPGRDPAYWGNFLNYGLGYIVDYKSIKSYTYLAPSYIDMNSPDSVITTYMLKKQRRDIREGRIQPYHDGRLFITLNFPYINWYQLQPRERVKTSGFLGAGLGLDYRYRPARSIEFRYDSTMDFFIPFPAPYDYELSEGGERRAAFASTYALTHKHAFNRWHIGYGVGIAKYSSTHHFVLNDEHIFDNHDYFSYGFLLPIHYYISKMFRLGMLYRPTFYRPSRETRSAYEHVISIDFGWRIRLVK